MCCLIKFLFGTISIIVALLAIGIGYLKLDNVYRQKLFATFLNKPSDPNYTAIMNIQCSQLLKHSNVNGQVLEIGSGTRINFPCLHNNTNIQSYIGIEPNIHMYSYFYDFVKILKISYEIRVLNSSATDMHEVESNSIDAVTMTFVLCSIPDPLPEKVLLEAHRILKSGGKFILFEHVLANPETNPFTHGFQKVIKPITNYFDAMKNIYSKVEYEYSKMPVPLFFMKDVVKEILVK